MTYNHAYTLGFEVSGSTDEQGRDVTEAMLLNALNARIRDLWQNNEFREACGEPYDTYVEGE